MQEKNKLLFFLSFMMSSLIVVIVAILPGYTFSNDWYSYRELYESNFTETYGFSFTALLTLNTIIKWLGLNYVQYRIIIGIFIVLMLYYGVIELLNNITVNINLVIILCILSIQLTILEYASIRLRAGLSLSLLVPLVLKIIRNEKPKIVTIVLALCSFSFHPPTAFFAIIFVVIPNLFSRSKVYITLLISFSLVLGTMIILIYDTHFRSEYIVSKMHASRIVVFFLIPSLLYLGAFRFIRCSFIKFYGQFSIAILLYVLIYKDINFGETLVRLISLVCFFMPLLALAYKIKLFERYFLIFLCISNGFFFARGINLYNLKFVFNL